MEKFQKIIEKNNQYLNKIKAHISKAKKIEEKLELIEFAARFCSINVIGKLYDGELENLLASISKQVIIQDQELESRKKEDTILHILSMVYETGGHTRLLRNLIAFSKSKTHFLIINYPEQCRVPDWLSDVIHESGGRIILNREKNHIEKARYLYEVSKNFETKICFTHTWDIIPSVAFGHGNMKGIYFYNHSDHLFNIGMGSADYIFEMSGAGAYVTNQFRIKNKSIVLPIPLEDPGDEKRIQIQKEHKKLLEKHKMAGKTIVLSIGSEEKYKEDKNYSFNKFLTGLLNRHKDFVFILAGPDPKKRRWKNLVKRCQGRLILTGRLNKERCDRIYRYADVYMDSFPVDSFTCTLDAVMKDIPCVSLKMPEANIDELEGIKCGSMKLLEKQLVQKAAFQSSQCVALRQNVKMNHCQPQWGNRFLQILDRPEKYCTEGHRTFDIQDFYEYMGRYYIGTKYHIKRADIRMLSCRNLGIVFRIFGLKIFGSIVRKAACQFLG